LHKDFFYYALRAVTAHVEKEAHGIIGLVHITKPELGAIRIPVPPCEEQKQIANHLATALKDINLLVERANRETQLIREYRARVIADVVTGKLDVRHLAPAEPLPAAEPAYAELGEAIDDEEEMTEADERDLVEEEVDA
jgi:type I restriction enzyme S subunit